MKKYIDSLTDIKRIYHVIYAVRESGSFRNQLGCVIRTKENIWIEYYHLKCLEKRGMIRRVRQIKQ